MPKTHVPTAQANPCQRSLLAVSIAALLSTLPVAARADDAELKALVQQLTQRLNAVEAELAAQRQANQAQAAAPAAPAAAAAPAVARAPALTTDQNGTPLGQDQVGVGLYDNGQTSLTMYGIVEPTISHADHQTTGGGTTTGFQTSWFSGNRLGFDVQHALAMGDDIGLPGLKAIAKLESEFELPTGNMDTANVLFNRDAWMGFYSEDLGKLTFGRQNTLTRDFTNVWGDPYGAADHGLKEGGYSNVNNFKQLIFYSGGPTGTRYNSAVEWKKKLGPHWLIGVGYAFGSAGAGGSGDVGNGGSVPGDFSKGTGEAVSLAYNGIDLGGARLNLDVNYNAADVADLVHRAELIGGNLVVDKFRWNFGYIHYTAEQGANNSIGTRTDNSWTTSFGYQLGKTEFDLGYQEMKGSHAGFNGGGNILNPFGNTSGVTSVADGAKDSLYGSVIYHADKQTDFYLAADWFKVKGGWVLGDAQGNGNHYGAGQTYDGTTELATGVRLKF